MWFAGSSRDKCIRARSALTSKLIRLLLSVGSRRQTSYKECTVGQDYSVVGEAFPLGMIV
jgi:hypothetical protein